MMIPSEVGLSPIGDLTYAERVKNLLVRLQGEGGYPSDEESNRLRELLSMAYALGVTFGTLDAVGDNAFPQLAYELLEEHEAARRIPNDAPRTESERQLRAAIIDAAVPGGGAAGYEAALARAGITASMVSTSRAAIVAEGSEPDGIFQTLVQIAPSDWTLAKTTIAIDFLRRFLPALQLGQLHHVSPTEALVTAVDTVWAPGEEVLLGRCAIGDGVAFTQQRAPSRIKSYASRSRLCARDLNAIQDAAVLAACSGSGNDLGVDVSGSRRYAFAAFAASGGGTAELLTGLDFRDRLIRVFVRYSADDIRPGSASDTAANVADQFTAVWFTGPGGIVYQTGASGFGNLRASSTAITYETTGIEDRYIVGFLEVSGVITGGTQAQVIETFADDTVVDDTLNPTWWAAVRDVGGTRRATGAGAASWPGFTGVGGLHRVACIAHSVRPAAGVRVHVLDATEDWRDRLLIVEASLFGGTGFADAFYPGTSADHFFSFFGTTVSPLAYTRAGDQFCELDFGVTIYARASDGALCARHSGSFVGHSDASVLLVVHATDQLGMRSAAVPLTPPATPASAAAISCSQLNWIQDIAIPSQVRGLVAAAGVTGIDCDAMPLGPITSGTPKIPVAWTVRRRDGIANTAKFERRQPVAGGLRRVFACEVGATSDVVLDDAHDWRDRVVHGIVAHELGNDIRPGESSDALINSVTQGIAASYLGPGRPSGGAVLATEHYLAVSANAIALYARSSDGALMVRNSNASTRYLVGWVDASFPLGPRGS